MGDLAIPLKEFDAEMATTRRLLERVPADKGEWKPHPKSFPLGHLAQLVAWLPGWIDMSLSHDTHDMSKGGGGYSFEPTEKLLSMFDENVQKSRKALTEVTGGRLDEVWSLTHGDRVLMSTPRGEAARQHLGHLSHHRGQLTVYLRLLDIPLPSIYGPTADEKWG